MFFDPASPLSSRITFVIAVIGCVLSVLSWAKDILVSRRSFDIHALGVVPAGASTFVFLSFSNRSRLSITITGISCVVGRNLYPCATISRKAFEINRKNGTSVCETQQINTTPFPVFVPGLGGQQMLLHFEALPEALPCAATEWTVRVFSNRGRPVKMKLQLPQDPFDLHTLL